MYSVQVGWISVKNTVYNSKKYFFEHCSTKLPNGINIECF